MTSITINGQTYNLCTMPGSPGPSDIEIGMNDTVSVVTSPFTRQEQTQPWPGGDYWDATITLPPMTRAQASPWEGFLAELRGRGNVFQAADSRVTGLLGSGAGTAVVSTADGANLPMTWYLSTSGWTASATNVLKAGDYFQVGYRLYKVCENVSADSSGNASVQVWPSLRETPSNGTALVLSGAKGLFRLASNRRALQASPSRLTTMSFKFVEAK